ncbi:hypothetical protein LCGC14_1662080 [marine sediment metagenome]|uniref:Uncharacterized protein n=1 Tax=marine sediment metagenome TaxID=412755 RepID=A0A0F9KTU4_9ZZZZ
MSETANEPTTMVEKLCTGGPCKLWRIWANDVQEMLKIARQDLVAIVGDAINPTSTQQKCAKLVGVLAAAGKTAELLAQVCDRPDIAAAQDAKYEEERRERRETRRNLAAIDNLAMQLRRVRDEGDDTSDKCISAGIMTHVYELRSLLAIRE